MNEMPNDLASLDKKKKKEEKKRKNDKFRNFPSFCSKMIE